MTNQDSQLFDQILNALGVVEAQAERLALLNELSMTLNLVMSLDEMAQAVATQGPALLDCDWAGLAVKREASYSLVIPLVEGLHYLPISADLLKWHTLQQLELPLGEAILDAYLVEEQKLQSLSIMPMMVREQMVGLLWVGSKDAHGCKAIGESFLQQVAALVGAVVDNYYSWRQSQQNEQALAELASDLELVAQISVVTSTTLGTQALIQQVVDFTQQEFGLADARLFLWDDMFRQLTFGAKAKHGEPTLFDETLLAQTLQHKKGVITPSALAVPLLFGQRILGVLALQATQTDAFNPTDLRVYRALAAQIAVALQNAHLHEQAQQALLATEAFYEITIRLNKTTRLDEVIPAVMAAHILDTAQGIALFTFELNEEQEPEWVVCKATWSAQNKPRLTMGTRFHLPQFPFNQLWLTDSHEPVLVEDVAQNLEIDPNTRRLYEQLDVVAVALIPLRMGERWVGLMVVRWAEPYYFSAKDKQLFSLISNQAAVRVDNLLLLEATQQRANQLQWLASMEVTLSQATDEAEILTSITLCFDLEALNFTGWLQYLEMNEQGQPIELRNVAIWRDGLALMDDPELNKVYQVEMLPLYILWQDLHNELFMVTDVATDSRLDDPMRQELGRFNFKSFVLLPLWSSNHWEGLVLFGWDRPHQFSSSEQFYMRRLLEPLAAIIASRRARLAQEELLRNTERLYQASLQINAATNLQMLLSILLETVPLSSVNRGLFIRFNYDARGSLQDAVVVANWYRGDGAPPLPIGSSCPLDLLTALGPVLAQDPIILSTVTQLPAQGMTWLQQQYIQASVLLPLWVANQQLGLLWLQSDTPHEFTRRELQPYFSLIGQVAVAVENKLLLESTQARVQRERILREVTTQIRRAVDVETVMRTATRKIAQTFDRKVFIKLNDISE